MKRRIIKLGTTTLVTSLPSKWVRQFNLKPGDYVDVSERNKDLVLSTENAVAVKEKSLDCRKFVTRIAEESLVAAYILGYHTIEILHEPRIREYKTRKLIQSTDFFQEQTSHLIGMEIIEQSDTRTVMRQLAEVTQEELMNALHRAFYLTKEMGATLLPAIEQNDREKISSIKSLHRNVRKFILYFMRILNKQGHVDFAKTNMMFVLADHLGFIPSVYRVIVDDTLAMKKKYSRKALDAFRMTNEAVARFVELFFKFKPETALELIELREKINDVLFAERNRLSAEDALLYGRLGAIQAHLMRCIRAKFGLEL